MGSPYTNCLDEWPVTAKNSSALAYDYSLNSCISNFKNGDDLKCLPECEKKEYELGNIDRDVDVFPNLAEFFHLPNPTKEYTFVEIVFIQLNKKSIKEVPVITFVQFLGTFGGLCGLGMGISLITVAEFLEFFLINLYRLIRWFT